MPERDTEPLSISALMLVVLLFGCGSNASPSTTDPPSSYCPRQADDGSRYYVTCDP